MKTIISNVSLYLSCVFLTALISCNCDFSTIKTGDISLVSKLPNKVLSGEVVELNIVVDNPKNCEIDYLWETPDGKIEPQTGVSNVRYTTPCKRGVVRVICKIVEKANKEKIIDTKYIDVNVEQLEPSGIEKKFIPSGLIGDYQNITNNQQVYKGKSCSKITFSFFGKLGWVGIYWLNGQNFETAKSVDLKGYTKLTFWACTEGSAKVEFIVGSNDMDSFKNTTNVINLDNEWKMYSIHLNDKDLSVIKGGFCCVANKDNNKSKITFYLANVQYETEPCE